MGIRFAWRVNREQVMSEAEFPVGGPREPVYELMRRLGFTESNWSDKFWRSADGIDVAIYGAGSMARISLMDAPKDECKLADLGERIAAIRLEESK
jgi:hypothetical protein